MQRFVTRLSDFTDEQYEAAFARMEPAKQQRVLRLRRADDRRRTVAADALARTHIAAFCGISPDEVTLAVGVHGKPYAVGLAVEFCLSHSDDMVVCVVSDRPVGVDVERVRPVDLKIARRLFTREEQEILLDGDLSPARFCLCEDTATLARFYRFWTAKEAYFKRLGVGMGDWHPISVADCPDITLTYECLGDYILAACE